MRLLLLHIVLLLFVVFVSQASVAHAQSASVLNPSGLPLPRYASLKSDKINMRVGPGSRYPIAYTYTRKALPVEIIEEFAHWRRIRDSDGTTGWVHKNLLSGTRSAMITAANTLLRSKPSQKALTRLRIGKGRLAKITACEADWCSVEIEGYEGWLNKADFFGATREEVFEED